MKTNIFANLFKSNKGNTSNNNEIVQKLSKEAINRFMSKQYESVVALTDKIILLDHSNYNALNMRASSLENLGYYMDAIDDYNKAIELKPNDANMIGLCGLCYNSIGELQKSKEYLEKAVNMGMKMYATTLATFSILSEKTLKMMGETRNTPERRKRRTGNEFTVSHEAVDLDTINESLRGYYNSMKNALTVDPENKEIKLLVDHYKNYFEEA